MPDVADLRARASRRHAYVLFIEGIAYAWTDEAELAGTSWIGTAYGAGRTVIDGLVLPSGGWTVSVDVRGGGVLEGGQMRVGLIDRDGATLVDLFAAQTDDGDQLGQSVTPRTPPSQMEALAGVGTSVIVDARGRDIGLERIGPAGERRYYWIIPEPGIGLDHPVREYTTTDSADDELPAVYVTDGPRQFAGRKVALYEVHQDDDGTWKSWGDTYRGGGLVWCGTLRDEGEIEDLRTWQISCDGMPSWLARALNSTRPSRGYPVLSEVNLKAAERGIAVWFDRASRGLSTEQFLQHTGSFFHEDFTTTDLDAAALAARVATEVQRARNGGTGSTAGADGDYADSATQANALRWATFSRNSVSIRVNDSSANFRGTMHVCLHRKAWRALGWDLEFQRQLPHDDPRFVEFVPVQHQKILWGVDFSTLGDEVDVPGPDYWIGRFTTDKPSASENPRAAERTNDGNNRSYTPQFVGGAYYLDGAARQQIRIGTGNSSAPYLDGQAGIRPIQGAQVSGTDCDTACLWLFEGVRRTDAEEEDGEKYAQVAVCSWVDSLGRVGVDSNGDPAIHIDGWLDPRVYGLPYRRMQDDWGVSLVQEEPLTATPLGVIGACDYNGYPGPPDLVHKTLGRLMLSTGTATSSGSSAAPVHVQGKNAVAFAELLGRIGDYEVADHGLGIPVKHVDYGSLLEAMQGLPAFPSPLSRARYAYVGPIDSLEVIRQIMGPRGLAMGLTRGYFGPRFAWWSIYGAWNPDDVVATIDASTDLVAESPTADALTASQSIRWAAPIDRFSLSYGGTLGEGARMDTRALDPGARGRSGRVEHSVEDYGLVDPKAWEGQQKPADHHSKWLADWRELHQRTAAGWYAKRHFPLSLSVRRGLDLGVGDLVRYTDTLPASPAGEYGLVSYLARVVSLTHKPYGEAVDVTLLVQADPPGGDGRRHFGPILRVWGYDITAGAGTLLCSSPGVRGWEDGNWSGHGYNRSDVAGFGEPSWSITGGDCKAVIYQSFDGTTWGNAVTLVVDSVDEVAHTCTVSSVSGTLYRDAEKFMVLRAYADQDSDSWVRVQYGVITDETGDALGVAGWRFE